MSFSNVFLQKNTDKNLGFHFSMYKKLSFLQYGNFIILVSFLPGGQV